MSSNRAFRALADPTRRHILRLLRERPRSSGDIADAFDSSWPTISRHLAVLRRAGLIVPERKGKFIEYDVNTTVLQEVIELLLDAVQSEVPMAIERRALTALFVAFAASIVVFRNVPSDIPPRRATTGRSSALRLSLSFFQSRRWPSGESWQASADVLLEGHPDPRTRAQQPRSFCPPFT